MPNLAPDLTLPDQNGNPRSLHDYRGKWVVLYFYPGDDTSGCTTEACNFRDAFPKLTGLGVQVLGISQDDTESHQHFASKYQLNFPILSDVSGDIHKAYEVTGRTTFLINPLGEIAKTYPKVDPAVHAAEIQADLNAHLSQ